MRILFFFILLNAFALSSIAQNEINSRKVAKQERVEILAQQEEEGIMAFRKSSIFGIKLNTDGYGAFYEFGRTQSVRKALLFQFEIDVQKHPKEEKTQYQYSYNPYIFGKENFVYPLKFNVQQQILLGNKTNKNGVSVTGNYGGGISLALLRPYYVQVFEGNSIKYIKYNSRDSLTFIDPSQVVGGPVLSKGWNEITVTPGLNAKTGLRFDYGAYNELVSALEVGVSAQYYLKGLPEMVYNKPEQFFFNAYVTILFGKRK